MGDRPTFDDLVPMSEGGYSLRAIRGESMEHEGTTIIGSPHINERGAMRLTALGLEGIFQISQDGAWIRRVKMSETLKGSIGYPLDLVEQHGGIEQIPTQEIPSVQLVGKRDKAKYNVNLAKFAGYIGIATAATYVISQVF